MRLMVRHAGRIGAIVLLIASAGGVYAAPAPEQSDKLQAADKALREAAAEFREDKFTAAGELVKQAQSLIAELSKSGGLDRELAPLVDRLRNAHALLEIEGVLLPPLDLPARTPAEPAVRKPQKLASAAATSENTVQFSRDIAKIFVENCFDCHARGRRNGGQLSLETFAGLMRGGGSGVAVSPGNPADSLLVKKLRGTAGARMPLDRDSLPDADIAKIEHWIREKAPYDAGDPELSLELVIAAARAATAGHEQLAADRAILARQNWRLALPDEQPDQHETNNFFLLGNIGPEPLEELGKVAEEQAAAIAKMIRAPEGEPLVKGRITLFAFKSRADYSEWRNVDGRNLPAGWRGHWKYNVVEAYACIVPPSDDEYGLAPLVSQQVASIAVASLGSVPEWFADGSGRVMAARIDPRDARVRAWQNQFSQLPASSFSPDNFLAGKLPPEQQQVFNFAVVRSLATNPQKYQGILAHLRQGAAFDQAFARVYGATPQETLSAWTGRPSGATPARYRR